MIARKSALILTAKLIDGATGYVALFFITKYMNPIEYGIVGFALSFVTLFSILGNLGFDSAHVKKISEGKDTGTCIGTMLVIKISLIGSSIAVLLSAIFVWKHIMGLGFETPQHELAIYIMMGYLVLQMFDVLLIATFKAKKEIAKVEIPFLVGGITRVVATIYVAIAGYGALALAFTYILGELANFILLICLFRSYPIKRPSFTYFKDYASFSFPILIIVVFGTAMASIDKILIQLFWTAEDVGYYTASSRICSFINMFSGAIGAILLPTFSGMCSSEDVLGIRRLMQECERYLLMSVVPMIFGIVALAQPIATILLSGWTPTVPILRILPFYVLFAVLLAPYESYFVGINKTKVYRNRVAIMFCCDVVLNVLLIPADIKSLGIKLAGLGAQGAAISLLVSYGIGLFYSRTAAWKLHQIKGDKKNILMVVAGGCMAIILYILLYEFHLITIITRWYILFGFSLLGLMIYLGILFLFGEFRKKEFYFVLDVLNIKKMINYIKEELKSK